MNKIFENHRKLSKKLTKMDLKRRKVIQNHEKIFKKLMKIGSNYKKKG